MKHPIEKMRACLDLLPPPGGEVVAECLDEIESLRKKLLEAQEDRTLCYTCNSVLDKANDALYAREGKPTYEQLEQQLETERMRLAACGVVAMSNTPDSAVKVRDMLPQYYSASCDDVARLVDREMELRQQVSMLQKMLDDMGAEAVRSNRPC